MNSRQLKKLVAELPNVIRITNKVSYELLFIDEFPDGKTFGECRFNTKQIIINKNQSNTEMLKTVIHETIHAIALENDINLTESHVVGLEKGLFRVLKLNKLLAK